MPPCRRILALLALTLPAAAHADTWWCELSAEGTRLVCVADDESRARAATAPASLQATAVVNGTRFPLDPLRVYTVPLWSPPSEPAFVHLLARSTLCFRSPDCKVRLAPSPWLR